MQKKFTKLASHTVSSSIHEQESLLFSVIRIYDLMDMERSQQRLILSKLLFSAIDEQHRDIFESLVILDYKGKELVRISRDLLVTDSDLKDRSAEEEFMIPSKKAEIYYSPVFYKEQTGEPLINISIPIIDIQSMQIKGVIIAGINLKFMLEVLQDIQIGESGTAYILSQNGRVVVHPNPSVVLKGTYMRVPDQAGVITGIQGKKSLVASDYMQFGGQTLKIVTELPVSEAEKYAFRTLLAILGFLVITLIGAVTMGYILVRQIIQPIESLSGIAHSISRGDYSQSVQVARDDEIGALSSAFNTMTSKLIETISSLKKQMTELKQAEDQILHQNELLNNIINSLTHPFYVIDAETYEITMANAATHFGDLTEKSKCYLLTHKHDKPCEGDEHPCTIREIMKTKRPVVLEHTHYNSIAKPGYFNVYGYPIFDSDGNVIKVIEYTIDITDKKKMEKQFLQAQKMEAVGNLAGGIAHDFNNLLSAIIGYSEMALTDLSSNHPAWEKIKIIMDAGEKAAMLTRQILAFSRKQILEIKVINLNSVVENMSKILRRVIGDDVQLEINTRPAAKNVKADAGQIEQVLMNLSVNARDAMPDGGRLIIETENIELDEEYARNHEGVEPGSYVMLAVTDTGVGMNPEVQEKIFEPFFTTKGDKGTGLGLSTIYGIVKQHGGHIYVYSEPNVGSTFKIYLPSTGEEKEEEVLYNHGTISQGTERILVVDDEPSIRRLIMDTLQPLGYRLLEASCGREALQINKTTDGEIDILLTDVVMPEMNGMELADIIRESRPSIKVIFTSGYTDRTIFNHDALDDRMSFLQKPITPKKLVSKLNNVLREKLNEVRRQEGF